MVKGHLRPASLCSLHGVSCSDPLFMVPYTLPGPHGSRVQPELAQPDAIGCQLCLSLSVQLGAPVWCLSFFIYGVRCRVAIKTWIQTVHAHSSGQGGVKGLQAT